MKEQSYHNAFDIVLDWRDAQERELTAQEQMEIAEAEAQIDAYTGRSYGEIRMDIARCAVARLDAMQVQEPTNVTPIRPSRSEVIAATRYIATRSAARE